MKYLLKFSVVMFRRDLPYNFGIPSSRNVYSLSRVELFELRMLGMQRPSAD